MQFQLHSRNDNICFSWSLPLHLPARMRVQFFFSCNSHKNWTFQHVSIVIVLLLIVKKNLFRVKKAHWSKKRYKTSERHPRWKMFKFQLNNSMGYMLSNISQNISFSKSRHANNSLAPTSDRFHGKKERLILSSSIAFNNFISIQ